MLIKNHQLFSKNTPKYKTNSYKLNYINKPNIIRLDLHQNKMGEAYHIKDPFATYFLTFQVVKWIDVFTRKTYRDIVVQSFNYCIKEKGLVVYAWVIMSNHVHCIVNSTPGVLADTVRDLKTFTAKQIIKSIQENGESRKEWMLIQFKQSGLEKSQQFQLWTHENHAIEINPYQPMFMQSKINYIHNNPVSAGIVTKPEEYIYSSANQYYTGKASLIPVEVIVLS